ncbi:MAG: MotA/TolQ/ExbB proton channel family protein [Planctomycetaceae bacterium]|jgi:biopolymer transport protein ExbB/TolQ|nr:MotA/TolQ/ExbB proton channel family protein [Planctomycetaceae bacterium]
MSKESRLCWSRSDIEQKFGFRGGRFTAVNSRLCATLALVCSVLFYVTLYLLPSHWFSDMFTQRGMTPYFMVLLATWSLFILLFKSSKVRFQQRSLNIMILPSEHDFVLSPNTVDQVLRNINEVVEQPKHFFLFNRITGTLSNLKNIGMISDVGNILRSYNDQDIESVETSYSLLNGFLWAIPVLGFIGTVEGLSKAIGTFGNVLANGADTSALTESLQSVTGGLATAFETTLVALILALVLHLFATAIKKSEEELLITCSEYCSQHIVAHLRMPSHRSEEQERI